tara:strand:- start:1708 stop:2097 length:390 start_codon:yes stop_codon:yes gene_type:complete
MKMSQLKMVIREVVREEIRLGLKELLGGVKKQPVQEQVQKPQPKKKQYYSKNPVLNEVLNETDASDWEQMGEKKFTSDRMGEIMGNSYKDLMGNNQSQNGVVTVDGQQPDFLKKDYRKLMDAVDKKQGK